MNLAVLIFPKTYVCKHKSKHKMKHIGVNRRRKIGPVKTFCRQFFFSPLKEQFFEENGQKHFFSQAQNEWK